MSTESRLLFRDNNSINWAIGAMFTFIGVITFVDGKQSPWFSMALLGFGVLMLLWPNVLTVSVDKSSCLLTLGYRSVLNVTSKQEIPLSELQAIRLERSAKQRQGRFFCRIVVVTKDGKETPFRSYYNRSEDQKQQVVNQIRAFTGIHGD